MSQLSNCNLNSVGHETISLINDFSHQILNNVCDFVQPVVQHINPHINITNNEQDYVNKYIDLERHETEDNIMLLGYLPGVIKDTLNTMKELVACTNDKDILIGVDGGVNLSTIDAVYSTGIDITIVG